MKSITLKALGIILSAFFVFTAQGQTDKCFLHKALYTTRPVEIRSGDSYFAGSVAKTTRNKTYDVLESRKAALFGSCWIKISDGWLLRRADSSAIRPKVPTRQTPTPDTSATTRDAEARPTTTGKRCFPNNTAYITGGMNIRENPSASSAKVGSAIAGQSYYVSQSQRDDSYCWLKVSDGWIAWTKRVTPNKPTTASTVTRTTSSHIFADLTVQGPPSFKSAINKALSLLKRRAPSWYNYVVAKRTVIKPNTRRFPFTVSFTELGGAQSGTLWIGSTHDKDTGILAGVLVHESCHVHQWDDGRHAALGRIGREIECMELQIKAMQQASPGHHFIRRIQEVLRDPSALYG